MKAYLTLLGTNSYFDGVLGLYQSLKEVGAHYPLVCAVTPNISIELRKALMALEIEVVEVSSFEYGKELIKRNELVGMPHWNFTSGKFSLFGLTQFKKVVYLDCDMMVLQNLDWLFECENFTAAPDSPMCAEKEKRKSHLQLNSGLVVFEPSKELEKTLKEISLKYKVQDQDALRIYCKDWVQQSNLHLPQEYNLFAKNYEQYAAAHIDLSNAKVIHFIGHEKPWHTFKLSQERNWSTIWEGKYLSYIGHAYNELSQKFDF